MWRQGWIMGHLVKVQGKDREGRDSSGQQQHVPESYPHFSSPTHTFLGCTPVKQQACTCWRSSGLSGGEWKLFLLNSHWPSGHPQSDATTTALQENYKDGFSHAKTEKHCGFCHHREAHIIKVMCNASFQRPNQSSVIRVLFLFCWTMSYLQLLLPLPDGLQIRWSPHFPEKQKWDGKSILVLFLRNGRAILCLFLIGEVDRGWCQR